MNPTARLLRSSEPPATFDAPVFRRVIGAFTSGVVIVSVTNDGVRFGATVSAVSSLSLDPPMLLVCLNSASATQRAVRAAGVFAVNVLAEHQEQLARRFARSGDGVDKFAGLKVRTGVTGSPVLAGALAVIECEVAEVVTGGTHQVFLARVVHAVATEGSPLAYFRGRLSVLEIQRDTQAYEKIRELVLSRSLGPNLAVSPESLADRVGLSASSVYYALTRLIGDGLVVRDAMRGYLVRALDPEISDDMYDARLAIELGVAELVVGRLDQEQLNEFRRLAQATGAHVSNGRVTDVRAFVAANVAFHEFPVDACGSEQLSAAFRRLGMSEMLAGVASAAMTVSAQLIEDHLDLVAAYTAADLAAVKSGYRSHCGRAKGAQRLGIEGGGGSV